MTPEQLKASILQRAMEGKLVPQNPNDEPASELLKRIKAEKEKLISEGKIKRDKKETEIFRGDDGKHYEKFADGSTQEIDVPYDIPDSWEWRRINNVLDVRDGTHSTPKYVNKGVPLLTSKNLVDGKLVKEPSKLISIEDSLEINKRSKVDKNDILLAMIGTIGNPVLVPKISYDFSVKNIAIFKNMNSLNMKYIYFFIVYHTNELKKNASGAVQSFVSLTRLRNIIIPLPPLSEQQRIVEAIESALEKVDEYAESYNRLEQLDKEFPDKLKKSILQYAMQGKLVEQDPNDESVEVLLEKIRAEKQKLFEEGKIKKKDLEISIVSQGDDNSYYEEVPNTWQLFKLKNLLQLDNGTKQQNERLIYWDVKTLRGIKDAEFKEKGNKVHSKDTVILVDGENSGELFIIPHDGYMGSTFKKIHYLEAGSKKYIDLYIDSKKELLKNSKTGSAIPHLNKTLFKELIVALPPIQEQKRISSKITQIFSQINRLI
ncbi:restriction endonuclease subunit S [Streptococcus infantis]|uniref:restriction endonuclease subunit S n=2 Tax=Streptococcus infantis TaxID=68892 RepID=UPI001CC00BE7|nr:restriction endonuclease subunit S [Streptococcus infantis]MBZ2119994.1 restriction endonuclease subunit S [Streptococcus infantis]